MQLVEWQMRSETLWAGRQRETWRKYQMQENREDRKGWSLRVFH
jgi:hypothetical protein